MKTFFNLISSQVKGDNAKSLLTFRLFISGIVLSLGCYLVVSSFNAQKLRQQSIEKKLDKQMEMTNLFIQDLKVLHETVDLNHKFLSGEVSRMCKSIDRIHEKKNYYK